jgi:LPXTG-motif cell wall-anchored protein
MKTLIRFISTLLVVVYMTSSSYAAYEVVTCDSDASYTANSCDQCFNGGAVVAGDNKGLLTDVWENNSDKAQILFKEEQEMPRIVALGGASWTEVTASDSVNFWQYTAELDALYDEDNLGYSLPANSSATWIESTLGSAYQLVSSSAASGENVGMVIYDIATHATASDGTPALDSDLHRECVLFTSGAGETPVIPETSTLPETGAEHVLLLLIAAVLGFGFLKFRKK